ncbi:transcriptional regulator [Klebsiella pneumoniae]|nr:transcriptional regulator [Klebsiella pneumoniae]
MRLEFERPGSARAASLDEAFSGLFHATRKLGFDAVIYDYTPVPRSLEEGADYAFAAENVQCAGRYAPAMVRARILPG